MRALRRPRHPQGKEPVDAEDHRVRPDASSTIWTTVDYIERVKTQQRNWIGRSTGAEVDLQGHHRRRHRWSIPPGPTPCSARPTWSSPRSTPWCEAGWTSRQAEERDDAKAYQKAAASKSDLERTELNKEKTGVELDGVRGINPVNGKEIPIFISDYVLATYGTGAIMAVPAHDDRDWEFAKKFGCEIIEVVSGGEDVQKAAFTAKDDTGIMVNSDFLNGLTVKDAIPVITKWLEEKGIGHGQGELQAAGLGVLPPALLGRAHPHGLLREVRLAARARGSAAPAAARGGELRAHRRRRVPPVQDDRLGQHHLPLLRRPRQARDRHHAPVGRLQLVLPAVYGPPQRQGAGLQGGPGVLEPGGLVQRRHGAHHPAPALLPVLAQVPLRHRRRAHARSPMPSAPATA